MTNLGFAYLDGDGVAVDKKAAEEWFVKAAETGDADAEVALGTRYAQGDFGEVDYVKAVEWWLKSAQQGNAAAMWYLGTVYRRGEKGVEKNLSLSFDWFKRSAEAGDLDGMKSLGLAYLQGLGTVADEEKAKEWLIRAAENGNSSAECTLGALYARDDYWDKNLIEAVKWWTLAAEHKNAQAMCNLGQLFSDTDLDDGTIQLDLEKARKWFRDADEAGNEDAAYFLGLDASSALGKRYETYSDWQKEFKVANSEPGVARRILRKAGSWFQKPLDIPTANDDLAGACLRWLARIARYQEDLENAKDLYRQAAEKGDEKAKKELAEMESNEDTVVEPNVVEESRPSVPAAPQASVAPPPSAVPSVPVSTVPPPAGDETGRAEALFLRKARRLKRNDGRIDPDETKELRELAVELGLSALRREELIEQVEEEYEAGI
jgi:TPR repeat protein